MGEVEGRSQVTPWELLIAAGLYVSVAVRYWNHGDYGMVVVFVGYAVANGGFLWSAWRP